MTPIAEALVTGSHADIDTFASQPGGAANSARARSPIRWPAPQSKRHYLRHSQCGIPHALHRKPDRVTWAMAERGSMIPKTVLIAENSPAGRSST